MADTTTRKPLKLRIGELAQRTGRSVHTIRWYEQQGLLPPVPRLGTHRLYSNRHVEWLELMDRLRLSGMPIAELRRYTALAQRGASNLEATRAVLLAHRERVDAQIAQWKLWGSRRPVALSSSRSSTWRMMRKDEGTRPEASPEWMPSVRISTLSVPLAMPAEAKLN
eukprot:gene91-120_t